MTREELDKVFDGLRKCFKVHGEYGDEECKTCPYKETNDIHKRKCTRALLSDALCALDETAEGYIPEDEYDEEE